MTLVDACPASYLAFHYFDLAAARIVILLAFACSTVARVEGALSFGVEKAFAFALCAVCAAFTAIWIGHDASGQLTPANVADRAAHGPALFNTGCCRGWVSYLAWWGRFSGATREQHHNSADQYVERRSDG